MPLSCSFYVDVKVWCGEKCHLSQYKVNTKISEIKHEEDLFFPVAWEKSQIIFYSSCNLCTLQIWTSLSNVPTSALSTCSLTPCWTPSSRAWPTDATRERPLTRVCAWAAERTAATSSATTSTRSAWAAALRCTLRPEKLCLTKVNMRKKDTWKGPFVGLETKKHTLNYCWKVFLGLCTLLRLSESWVNSCTYRSWSNPQHMSFCCVCGCLELSIITVSIGAKIMHTLVRETYADT